MTPLEAQWGGGGECNPHPHPRGYATASANVFIFLKHAVGARKNLGVLIC